MHDDPKEFVHLHVHSEYSLLDGLSRIKDLVSRAIALNQPAIALTDHGAMYGTMEFYQACKEANLKPIIGIETYLAARTMADRDPFLDKNRFHMLLLAQDQAGYRNLLEIATRAQLEGYYYKPRIDREFMARHSEGLIATTGCMAGEIPRAIGDGNMKLARQLMGEYLDIFGRDRFFIELQEHSIPELTELNKVLLELAPEYGLEGNFLATNDVHYTLASDAVPHDILLCVQTSATFQQPNRMRFSDKGYFLKSYDEMAALFGQIPGALSNSLRIAEMCQVDLGTKKYHLPEYDVPAGETPASYLRRLCEEGLARRYGVERAASDEALRQRLYHELNIIKGMGFDSYFLIVWDLCEWAARSDAWWQIHHDPHPYDSYDEWKKHDIWWNVRGSGAGSVVAYTLGITSIDPLANGLIFERFLNPGRVSMPDIDLDYPDDARHLMVEYTMRRYGREKVAQIITFGTMGARAAIRDVGRVLDMPLPEVDRLARMIPAVPGKPVKIENVLDNEHEFFSAEFLEVYRSDKAARELIEMARHLEGVTRHASSHAAGVIVSDKPLQEYVPLNRPTSGEEGLGGVDRVTQWPMEIVESIGLLKVDFLGLSTLTVMRRAARLIEERYGTVYTMDNIPYDEGHVGPDPSKKPEALFDMLGRGEVAGVFQVEGAGMRKLMMEMKPRRFDHIVAAISLYRPGPMENIPEYIRRMHAAIYEGKDSVHYHTPALEPILHDTYGILVYQEQIIRIASDLAGYEPGEADMIRKAVSKKKKDLMEEHRLKFTEGAMSRGFSREVCEAIWGDIEFFARYGFNKAHAADYGKVTCQTAFLKAHYPVEYLTAMLSVERDNTEKVRRYFAEAKSLGIAVAPPDVNRSGLDFTIEDEGERPIIRFGLGAIKNAGEAALRLILDEREANGPFTSLSDLCERVDLRRVGKRALEYMSKGRAFDSWGTPAQFLEALDRILAESGNLHDAAASGQLSLFGGLFGNEIKIDLQLLPSLDEVKGVTHKQMLEWEKEALGVHVSEHPLERPLAMLQARTNAGIADLDETWQGKPVTVAGVITTLRTLTTKKGEPMAFGALEDLDGSVEVVFFPRTWQQVRNQVQVDQVMLVRGKVQVEETRTKIIVDGVQTSLELATDADEPNRRAATTGSPIARQPAVGPPYFTEEDPYMPPPAHLSEPMFPYEPPLDGDWQPDYPPLPDYEEEWTPSAPAPRRAAAGNSPMPAHKPPAANSGNGAAAQTQADTPTQGNGAARQPAAAAAAPTAAASPPRIILVEIDPRGNWREACRQSVKIASRYDGPDRFRLQISGQKNYIMEFPNHRTLACDELLLALRNLPGVRRVE